MTDDAGHPPLHGLNRRGHSTSLSRSVDSREDCSLWELQELIFAAEKEIFGVRIVIPDHHAET
ncbi:hypothetical protein CCP3SC1AL1_1710006 [Gammaproteobacteria bacterium]